MGLKNFDEIVENVKYMISKNPHFRVMCSMALLEENKHEIWDFKKMWGRRHTRIAQFVNWGGYKHDPIEVDIPKDKHFCHHLKNMYVLWDGRVCLCCMDYDGRVILGDLNKQTVKEVWDNSKWIRDKQLEGKYDELELCKDCNLNCNKVVRY
jgi:molybdenum cofactor biosynthesis enzyme MoaA